MNGVADNVKIMTIRAVPNGDEHDKDIALAIRYAVDNGAQVINMSFGKGYSPQKHWVDEAVRYAESKDVLLVHAAGNSHENIDVEDNFPNALLNNDTSQKFTNWITVGASGDVKQGSLVAEFSNYGKNQVDVFAPGVEIYSTMPGGDKYDLQDGTSMASPVVAGLAALLRSYFPQLTASQIKYSIEKSATTGSEIFVTKPGTEEEIKFSEISRTGGIINAFEAIKIASLLKGEKKSEELLPQPKLKRSVAN
jgi:subtilisin family serine protease